MFNSLTSCNCKHTAMLIEEKNPKTQKPETISGFSIVQITFIQFLVQPLC